MSKSRFLLLPCALGLVGLMVPATSWANKVAPPNTPAPDPASVCDAIAGNIVTNCGFEADLNATGWTIVDLGGNTFVAQAFDTGPNSGTNFLALGAVGSQNGGGDGSVSQLLSTVTGDHYLISYYLASDGGTPSEFSASFGATTLGSTLTNTPAGPYILYSFVASAGSSSTLLNFNERNDPSWWGLDDVSVVNLPEPSSLVLFGTGLLGLAILPLFGKKTRRAVSQATA
jgi:hypothetical protein